MYCSSICDGMADRAATTGEKTGTDGCPTYMSIWHARQSVTRDAATPPARSDRAHITLGTVTPRGSTWVSGRRGLTYFPHKTTGIPFSFNGEEPSVTRKNRNPGILQIT
jgi:hypothetical protein